MNLFDKTLVKNFLIPALNAAGIECTDIDLHEITISSMYVVSAGPEGDTQYLVPDESQGLKFTPVLNPSNNHKLFFGSVALDAIVEHVEGTFDIRLHTSTAGIHSPSASFDGLEIYRSIKASEKNVICLPTKNYEAKLFSCIAVSIDPTETGVGVLDATISFTGYQIEILN